MPEIDIGRSEAAAVALRSSAENLRSAASSEVRLSDAAGDLAGSGTLDVVHDLHSAIVLRVVDAVSEYRAVADGIEQVVANTVAATGGAE